MLWKLYLGMGRRLLPNLYGVVESVYFQPGDRRVSRNVCCWVCHTASVMLHPPPKPLPPDYRPVRIA
jgi:hypothetical protein